MPVSNYQGRCWIVVLACLCILHGCQTTKEAPLESALPGQKPPPVQTKQYASAEPPLSFTYPSDMHFQEERLQSSLHIVLTSSEEGGRLDMEIKALANPIDIDALGQALIAVDQRQLAESGAAEEFSVFIMTRLAGERGIQYTFSRGKQTSMRILLPVANNLYTLTVRDNNAGKGEVFADILSSLQFQAPFAGVEQPLLTEPAQITVHPGPDELLDDIWSFCPFRIHIAEKAITEKIRDSPRDNQWTALDVELQTVRLLAFKEQNRVLPPYDGHGMLQRMQAAAEALPDSAQARRALGLLLMQNGKMSDARQALKQAHDMDSSPYSLLAMAFWHGPVIAEVEPILKEVEAYAPDLSALWLYRAWLAQARGDVRSADAAYRVVLRTDSLNTAALIGLGRLEMDSARTRLVAAERFAQALGVNPQDDVALYNLAAIWYREGDHEQALKSVQQLVDTHPRDADAWCLRGQILRNKGEYQDAASSFRQAVEIDPGNAGAFFLLGVLCVERLADRDCARQAFADFLRLEPDGQGSRQFREWLSSN